MSTNKPELIGQGFLNASACNTAEDFHVSIIKDIARKTNEVSGFTDALRYMTPSIGHVAAIAESKFLADQYKPEDDRELERIFYQLLETSDRLGQVVQLMRENPGRIVPIKTGTNEERVNASTPTLRAGEKYAGVILDENQRPLHHLILLPGDAEELTWDEATAWAVEQGGELPTRREQSLLFANLKGEFESAYYWSGERHESNSGWAWYQTFSYGYQLNYVQHHRFRARAVRRLPI